MGATQQPAVTTQIQKTELPAWVDAASQANYAQAAETSNNLTPSAPQNVAGQNDLQNQAVDWLNQSTTQSRGLLAQAAGMFGNASQPITASTVDPASIPKLAFQQIGYTPTQAAQAGAFNPVAAASGVKDVSAFGGARDVTAKSFLDANLGAYLNPYTQNVIDATDQASRRDESLSLMKNSDANRASGAWGGSRDAITNAVIQSEGIRNRAQTDATLRSAGFTDAAGRIMQDNANNLTAQQSNQGADISKGQINANIGIANQNSALNTQSLNQNTFLQNALQDLQSRQYDATNRQNSDQFNATNTLAKDQFNSSGKYGADNQNASNFLNTSLFNAGAQNNAAIQSKSNQLAAAGGMAGLASSAGQMGNAQSLLAANLGQSQQANTQAFMDAAQGNATLGNTDAANALNMKLAALGMSPYGKTTTSNSTSSGGTSSNTGMSILGAGMSILPMLFSDRNVKKDIKHLGKVEGTNLNKYEFRYKKGFEGNTMGNRKMVGLMAQDVEKKVPGAVHRVNVGGKSIRAVDYGKAVQGASTGFMGN
jgi:hypothetical protein